jgi:hypothetical protein
VPVKLKLSGSSWVGTIIIGVLGSKVAPVEVFVATAINVIITSNNPNKFLNRVVEVQLDLVGKTAEGFFTLELKLFD